MNALLVVFAIGVTAITGVALGVFSAYYALSGLLAICNPTRPTFRRNTQLVPQPSSASGD